MAGPWEKYAAQPAAAPNGDVPTDAATPWQNYAPKPAATAYKGELLPFSKDVDGQVHFDGDAGVLGLAKHALSGLVTGTGEAITAPGRAMSGELQVMGPDGNVSPQAIAEGLNFAGLATDMAPGLRSGEAILPGAKNGTMKADVAVPTAEELKTASSKGYDDLRNADAQYSSQSVSDMAAQAQRDLEKDGFNATTAPKTFQNLQGLQQPPADSIATSSNLETARRTFGQVGQDFANPTDQTAAKRVRGAVDNFVGSPPDGSVLPGSEDAAAQAGAIAADARGNYAASKRSDQLNGLVTSAEDRAGASNSGQNIGNAIRQRAASILDSPKKSSGFTDDELETLRTVARGTPGQNLTRYMGNLLGGGGGLGAAVSAGIAGTGASMATGSPLAAAAGIAAPVVGALAKQTSNYLTKKALSQVDEATRMRSPVYQALVDANPNVPAVPAKTAAVLRALMVSAQHQAGGGGW